MGMPWHWRGGGGGGTTPTGRRCWGERGAVGVLRCWWGGGGASVAVKDDGGGGYAIALLGWWHYQGVRKVAGVGQRVRRGVAGLGGQC